MNYYNEFDPKTAAWLRELIKRGLIPQGDVDERSIIDVRGADLAKYTQCHFFAGIGGWSHALRLAGWPDDKPVWTGSCPCQPFSAAGKQKAQADERHLWPHMFRLIRECHPATVFGEQVEGAVRLGWLDGICGDMEAEGYAVGAHVLGAHSVGSPHIRQRLYWVADAMRGGRECEPNQFSSRVQCAFHGEGKSRVEPSPHSASSCGLGNAEGAGSQGHGRSIAVDGAEGREGAERLPGEADFWCDFDLLPCLDGKQRRIESGTFPLAHGVPARVVRLRGYGNAIVPQVAAEFARAYLTCGE